MHPSWSLLFGRPAPSARRVAAWVTAAFAAVGIFWVLVIDHLLYRAAADPSLLRIQTANWTVVIALSVILYTLVLKLARRLAQARRALGAVVESMGDGVLVLGEDRTIVHANPAAARMLECPVAELVGMDAQTFSRRFLVSYASGAIVAPDAFASQRAFDEDGVHRYRAVLYPEPQRELVIISTAAGVRQRPGERAELVVSLMHDITDTENLERLRDRFFSAAAHSLKTPVAIIKANLQFISDAVPLSLRPSTGAIERQCNRIDRLVQNLLVVSRARSHSLQLHAHDLDLGELLQDTVHGMLEQDSLDIHTDIQSDPRVYGDPERLAIVIRNLTYEAIGIAANRTPITLTLKRSEMSAELAVHYHPRPIAERTFFGNSGEEYDDSRLSSCATQTIVAAHGGEVGESGNDQDATRWARLPMLDEAQDRQMPMTRGELS